MQIGDQLNPVQIIFWPLYWLRRNCYVQKIFNLYGKSFQHKNPVFILGVNRSGTSMFVRLVRETSALIDWSEANELWDPVSYPWPKNKVERSFWPHEPQKYINQMLEQNGEDYITSIAGIVSMYVSFVASRFWNVRFLNKSPMNSLRVRELNSLFPEAQYIAIVRDPVAVLNSWLKKIEPPLEKHPKCKIVRNDEGNIESYNVLGQNFSRKEMIEKMSSSYEYINVRQNKDLSKYVDKRFMIIKYESIAEDIYSSLNEVDDFLGIARSKRRWKNIPKKTVIRNDKAYKNFSKDEIALIRFNCKTVMETFYK